MVDDNRGKKLSVLHSTAQLMESSYQPILPGLPDELALRCLAKIPHGYHGCLETVSKRWRDVLRSTEYSRYKAKQGWSGDWVFLLTQKSKEQWIAYDPDADRWHPIAMIPGMDEYARSEGFGCCCVGNMFLVIGGSYSRTNPGVIIGEKPLITNQVFRFNPFTKEWSEAASMKTPRTHFGRCVISGKVYVCGGHNVSHIDGLALAEVYDPLTNKWEELPRMPNNLMDCLSLSRDGKLYAFTDRQGNGRLRNYNPLIQFRTEIFDPIRRVWRTEEINWPCSTFGRAEVQVTEDGGMYADVHVSRGLNLVMKMDDGGEWHVVTQLPSLGTPPDGSSWVKEVSKNNGFVALGNELYFMGGKAACLLHKGCTSVIQLVDLNRCWIWDGCTSVIQLVDLNRCWIWDGKWRETRPMCRPACGGVRGFAALKEMKM